MKIGPSAQRTNVIMISLPSPYEHLANTFLIFYTGWRRPQTYVSCFIAGCEGTVRNRLTRAYPEKAPEYDCFPNSNVIHQPIDQIKSSPVWMNTWSSNLNATIPHLPGCFCPCTFFQNIGFNMVPSDPFMSHLATQFRYSAGEFQALQLIVLATFGVVD